VDETNVENVKVENVKLKVFIIMPDILSFIVCLYFLLLLGLYWLKQTFCLV